MPKSKISWENLNGFKILRIHQHPIMSTGVWNQWYYDKQELKEAFENTDWENPSVRYLFYDHDDINARSWIGFVENPKFLDDGTIVADLVIADENAQKAILMGAKFGISPKIVGRGEAGSVKDFVFKNFSLVVEPACKRTFLNKSNDTKEGIDLIPNSLFVLNEDGERIMAEENVDFKNEETSQNAPVAHEESKQETQPETKPENEELKEKKKKKEEYPYPPTEEEGKEKKKKKDEKYPYPDKYAYPETKKNEEETQPEPQPESKPEETPAEETQQAETKPEVVVVDSRSKETTQELRAISYQDIWNLLEYLGKKELLNSEFAKFVKEYAKKHPELKGPELIKAAAKAWKKVKKNAEMEQKLSEEDKGVKLSVKGDVDMKYPTAGTTQDVDIAMLEYLRERLYNNAGDVTLQLSYEPKTNALGWRVFELASTVTSTTSTRGSAVSNAYVLQPIMYLKKAIDAAKERMRFMQIVTQYTLPEGHKDIIIPYRKKYLADSSWETSSAEYAAGSEISWTQINTLDGVQITPTRYNYGVALTNEAIRTNALNLVTYAREELSYKYENSIDSAIRDAILGTVGSSPTLGATEMSDTANGCQTIYGGDATDADNSLDPGDVLTTDLIAKAKRLLMSNIGYYWSSNTFTKSSTTKNAWEPTAREPFVLFIAPEQEEALLKDSQFVNASEYGSNEVVLNGEIGRYLGIKVISTTKVPAISSGDSIVVQGSSQSFDTNAHLCGLVKAGPVGALVWGVKPEIKVFDWPNADQVRMKLTMSYGISPVHSDAIVRIVVSDV